MRVIDLRRPMATAMKAVDLIAAVAGPRLTGDDAQGRLAVCEECDECERKGEEIFCTACGCGEWRLAELHKKVTMANARCPRGRWPDLRSK